MLVCAGARVSVCVCVCVRACVCACARALRIVSTERILRFTNTIIIIKPRTRADNAFVLKRPIQAHFFYILPACCLLPTPFCASSNVYII